MKAGVALVGADLAAGGVDRAVGGGVLGGLAAVDLARGGVADLVAGRERVRPLVGRVGARGHRLRLDGGGAPGRRDLARDHALDVVLQGGHVHRVPTSRARRDGYGAQLAAIGHPSRSASPASPGRRRPRTHPSPSGCARCASRQHPCTTPGSRRKEPRPPATATRPCRAGRASHRRHCRARSGRAGRPPPGRRWCRRRSARTHCRRWCPHGCPGSRTPRIWRWLRPSRAAPSAPYCDMPCPWP